MDDRYRIAVRGAGSRALRAAYAPSERADGACPQDHRLRRWLQVRPRPVSFRPHRRPLSRFAERLRRLCPRAQHPHVRDALKNVLDSDLPNLVQMDVSPLAGVLAERLLRHVPFLDKVFFANSGAESVEAAIKFARAATGRPTILYCGHAFHGLSYGALSLIGDKIFPRRIWSAFAGLHRGPLQ